MTKTKNCVDIDIPEVDNTRDTCTDCGFYDWNCVLIDEAIAYLGTNPDASLKDVILAVKDKLAANAFNITSVQNSLTGKVAKDSVPFEISIAVGDLSTPLTAGTTKAYLRAPRALTITSVKASVLTAPVGATLLTVDINESGTSILSTKLTFDAGEKTTTTATTAAVISDAAIAADAEITIDIDAVGNSTAGAGLMVTLIGTYSI